MVEVHPPYRARPADPAAPAHRRTAAERSRMPRSQPIHIYGVGRWTREAEASNPTSRSGVVGRVGAVIAICLLGRGQARALAFRRSNSAWSIVPASSSSLARAICSAGDAAASPVVATDRT
jgi:hypothetical protein